ncbi:MAG: hypothetical protein ACRC7N_11300 [Clostridium sp.]
MKPDQKYMPRDRSDLNFAPINLESPFHPSENGWMPVISLKDDMPHAEISNSSSDIFSPNVAINPYNLSIKDANNPFDTIPNGPSPNSNLYPNEEPNNELYSYNKNRELYLSSIESIFIEELLSDIDYNYDEFNDDLNRACNSKLNTIFKTIQDECPAIMKTLKSYKVPYPIAKILVKKIINISLENCEK